MTRKNSSEQGGTVQSIAVKHNVEMAHRLWQTPGKCQRIHGHSFQVTLSLTGVVDANGLLAGIDFGHLKRLFRDYLDNTYDHRVLLNEGDPWAGNLHLQGDTIGAWQQLPGLRTFPVDPTTENFARTIGEWAHELTVTTSITKVSVGVWETAVNYADWSWNVAS